MNLPESITYCIIGGGVHGLSAAWRLARKLKEKGRGSGADIVVLEKSETGAGASGIACGVVRNFYFSPAMCELVKLSVEVWEEDPGAFSYNPVGYIAAVPKQQVSDIEAIHRRQQEVGYTSEIYLGEAACGRHMRTMYSDFHCEGIEGLLHEKIGGYASPPKAVEGLTRKVEEQGVRILRGVTVTGFDMEGDVVKSVRTSRGAIRADLVVIGGGPWSGHFWKMLGLPMKTRLRAPDGRVIERPTFTYWRLREGSLRTAAPYLQNDGSLGPVIHLDHSIPLVDPVTGTQIDSGPWGIYWKKDASGVQGGGVPIDLGPDAQIEPYGRANQEVDTGFQDYFRAGLAWAMDRFRSPDFRQDVVRANGGVGCFTPDNYPIIDMVRSNVFLIADSNHGFKLLGVGKEVAAQLMDGPRRSLRPFRFARYEEGDLHPSSQSPFPWN
jgi:glycine/D-amino acid oxidase-like deaminating enzyme